MKVKVDIFVQGYNTPTESFDVPIDTEGEVNPLTLVKQVPVNVTAEIMEDGVLYISKSRPQTLKWYPPHMVRKIEFTKVDVKEAPSAE
jgi:hypothetical protein